MVAVAVRGLDLEHGQTGKAHVLVIHGSRNYAKQYENSNSNAKMESLVVVTTSAMPSTTEGCLFGLIWCLWALLFCFFGWCSRLASWLHVFLDS